MYLAEYELDERSVVHAVLRLQPSPEMRAPAYRSMAREAMQLAEQHPSSAGLRINAGAATDILLLSTMPEHRREELTGKLTQLAVRLEEFGTAEMPTDAEQYDEWLSPQTERFIRIDNAAYRALGHSVAVDFHPARLVCRLLETAIAKASPLVYQWQVATAGDLTETTRAAWKAILRFEELPGLPSDLRDLQREMADRLKTSGFLLDECLSLNNDFYGYVTSCLEDEFSLRARKFGFNDVPLMEDGLAEDLLLTGLHSSDTQGSEPIAAMASAIDRSRLVQQYGDLLSGGCGGQIPGTGSGGALENAEAAAFISYSSRNHNESLAICRGLEAAGIRCWMAPRDILPGEMYPDAIVRGIKAARAMVLVFSGYSNVSPHVLRELERAVSLNKIVIPLRLEHATLSNNMEYLISSCHWFDAVETPLDESVRGLVKKLERLLLD